MTSEPALNVVTHPVWAAWRIDFMNGCGLVVGWVRDAVKPWEWHPVIADDGGVARTPSTYPRENRRDLRTPDHRTIPAVVVELHTDEKAAQARTEALRREYRDAADLPHSPTSDFF